jgi:predicted DNA-binding transcriptional regulator YafY
MKTVNMNQLHRTQLLIEFLKRKPFSNLEAIISHFEGYDLALNERTFYRLNKDLRMRFRIEITFDHARNGYFIDEENSINLDSFLSIVKTMAMSDYLFTKTNVTETLSFIAFEKNESSSIVSNFKTIIEAIERKVEIHFQHFSFYNQTEANYTLKPYAIKQYQNRWYVIGETAKGYRSFGIDRMQEITLGTKKIKIKTEEALDKFSGVVGLNYSDHKREVVQLSFEASQKYYIASLPLHQSQQVIRDQDRYEIEIVVHPNFELKQQILKYGSLVKVIKPLWFAQEIKEEIFNAHSQYI